MAGCQLCSYFCEAAKLTGMSQALLKITITIMTGRNHSAIVKRDHLRLLVINHLYRWRPPNVCKVVKHLSNAVLAVHTID